MMLYSLVGFLLILLIVVGVLGMRGERETAASLETVYNDELVPSVLLAKIDNLRRENFHELLLARLHDPKIPESKLHEADHPVTKHTDAVEENVKKIDKLWEQYMATYLTAEEKKLAENYVTQREKFRSEGRGPAVALLKQRKFDEASIYITSKTLPLLKESEHDLEALMQLQVDTAKNEKDKADTSYARIRNITIASIVGGILLALGIGYWIISSITGRVTESVSSMSSISTEIASTVEQHERTASAQAVSANETTTTMDELSASTRRSAEQADAVTVISKQALSTTEEGIKMANQASAGMSNLKQKVGAIGEQILKLSEQTGQIGGIANMVTDIAGQINMLALNAAVEAVRAGESGKGFSVIAQEVRKLADQGKKSAEKVNTIVADIQKATNSAVMVTEAGTKTVEDVSEIAHRAGESFGSLSGIANSVYENAQQVSLNMKQQVAAIKQVTDAMGSINAGAKETAAGISQTKIGIQRLNDAAQELKRMV
ncbi:MAG: methyl-accepting chemotaxis protein [Nitrospinae bacterium]|nr:methyl-accepting chemotaxis protein [Nitrospinota bacterium]